jgi:hypothetical protein
MHPRLPPGYPLEMHQATVALINMELKAL